MEDVTPMPGRENIRSEAPLIKTWHEVVSRLSMQVLLPSVFTTDQREFDTSNAKDKLFKYRHNLSAVVEAAGYVITPVAPQVGLPMAFLGKLSAKHWEGEARFKHGTMGSEHDSVTLKAASGILDGPAKALLPGVVSTGEIQGARYKDFIAKSSKTEALLLMATIGAATVGQLEVAAVTGTGYLLNRFATLAVESADRTLPKWRERAKALGRNIGTAAGRLIRRDAKISSEEIA